MIEAYEHFNPPWYKVPGRVVVSLGRKTMARIREILGLGRGRTFAGPYDPDLPDFNCQLYPSISRVFSHSISRRPNPLIIMGPTSTY